MLHALPSTYIALKGVHWALLVGKCAESTLFCCFIVAVDADTGCYACTGVDDLFVHTMAVNEGGLRFYAQHGFRVVAEESPNAAHYRCATSPWVLSRPDVQEREMRRFPVSET